LQIQRFSELLVQNSRYKDGTTKNRSIVFSVVPYRALQSDRCLVIAEVRNTPHARSLLARAVAAKAQQLEHLAQKTKKPLR
jgi:hypothetical protein